MITEKDARYYCPGCRHTIHRKVWKRSKFRKSFCQKAGREIRMRLLKSQSDGGSES